MPLLYGRVRVKTDAFFNSEPERVRPETSSPILYATDGHSVIPSWHRVPAGADGQARAIQKVRV